MFEPDEVGYVPEVIDERTEGELRGALAKLADAMGPDAFQEAVDELILNAEGFIRSHCKPGTPALLRLEEVLARRERGF